MISKTELKKARSRFSVLHNELLSDLMTLKEAGEQALCSAENNDEVYYVIEIVSIARFPKAKPTLEPFKGKS